MKILIVGSINSHGGQLAPFITEQADGLRQCMVDGVGCTVEYFGVKGKGVKGYLGNIADLRLKILDFKPDIIHAHYGLCGLLAAIVSVLVLVSVLVSGSVLGSVPVVTTYHGCDINNPKIRKFSYPALWLSKYNIFVSKDQASKVVTCGKDTILGTPWQIIPCGVNTNFFHKTKGKATSSTVKKILFGSDLCRPEKGPELAKMAIEELKKRTGWQVKLIPLQGYTREEVVKLINQCDCGLLTSLREGSPQFSKEVLACHKPMVSTRVGDINEQFEGVEGAYIANNTPADVADKLQMAIEMGESTLPEHWSDKYDNKSIAMKLIKIYQQVSK